MLTLLKDNLFPRVLPNNIILKNKFKLETLPYLGPHTGVDMTFLLSARYGEKWSINQTSKKGYSFFPNLIVPS